MVLLSCIVLWIQPAVSFPLLWVISAAFWVLLSPLWLLKRCQPNFIVGWILLVPMWAALVDLHARDPLLLLAVMLLVWIADVAAYFTGRAFGRRKLASVISPSKTWEGAAGAVAGVLSCGLLMLPLLPVGEQVTPASLAVVLPALTALSIVGDLFESLVKRQANVKDSSQLLPGHGGLLDRIDSQTSSLPLAALLLHWIG